MRQRAIEREREGEISGNSGELENIETRNSGEGESRYQKKDEKKKERRREKEIREEEREDDEGSNSKNDTNN